YFPNIEIAKYKTFNKHATNLWCVIRYIHAELLKKFNKCDLYLADRFSLPICHPSRSKYSNLFEDKASWGYCAAKKERYYGFKVLLITTEQGMHQLMVLILMNENY
ncbi:MAG: hypothetical protein RLZZ293_1455, partial [Pseudomonadota bacterium]